MGGDPQKDPRANIDDGPADDALSRRVDRMEAEITALRGELAALRSASLQPAASLQAPVQSADAATEAASMAAGAVQSPQRPLLEVARGGGSLESRLGASVLSKVAVVLLLVGVAWFLKWAFDNRWIGPEGRVLAGLFAGAAVILWSEHFRRQRLVGFSYALKAVGAGVLYLSLWASFQIYHLVPALAAFAAMLAVTAWNAAMAWSQDAQLLAGYALLGAYLTPLLLWSGSDHESFLFSYLLAVAAALLALLWAKPWSRLLLGALPVTAGFFIAWYVEFFAAPKAWPTAIFALLLWAVFAVVPLLAAETGSVIANALEPAGAGVFGALTIYWVLADSGGHAWEAWSALGFAAVYLALAALARMRAAERSRSLAAAVHVSLSVAFVTAAITLKATGREITLGWLAEAVTMLVVGFWRRSALARWIGLVLLAATLIKTFAYDMRDLGTGYRVVSYLGLGVLLMAISFAYQKDWLGLAKTGLRDAETGPQDEPQRRDGEGGA